ncbi:probable glucosamine 6-phosphate N-acetyltransferase isoform X1 [Ornithodoros turicata]|uniref:probable glucosamine 6-phosphate N-acetyltransferase isoform X1 n=1 Tax=Ornithodoros turicata TaxID=34597 RepID=UPI0031395D52
MSGHLTQNGNRQEEFLYDPELLEGLDYKHSLVKQGSSGSGLSVDESLRIRPLSTDDFDKGYLKILSQMTLVGDISKEQFLRRFHEMKARPDTYYVTVVEDLSTGAVVAAASLVTELKFIRNTALRGRLEDVVVDDGYRGRSLGKLVVQTIVLLAEKMGCYKITLDCKDELIKFYTSNGFHQEPGNSNTMSIRFNAGPDGCRGAS